MKGQTMELTELLILVAGSAILIIMSYFLFSAKTPQTTALLLRQHNYERVTEAVKNFLYTRIPGFDKTYGQLLADMIINGGEDVVDYGERYGGVNVTKVVYDYFDNYFPGRWSLNFSAKVEVTHVLWIPNSGYGNSVSKISISDGRELGRYYTVPSGKFGNPSRVSLDKYGNVWIGNRGTRTLVKIGLKENGQCIDKNGDGVIRTSEDFNGDGVIEENEVLPFGTDECLLANLFLGGNDYGNYNDQGVRAVCYDKNQDVIYAGLFKDKKLFKISDKGDIEQQWDLPYQPYGCFVDKNGIVWISTISNNKLVGFNPQTGTYSTLSFNHRVYGIAPCSNEDCLVMTGWEDGTLTKVNTTDNSIIFEKTNNNLKGILYQGRGIIVDEEENIYAVSTKNNLLAKFDKDGNIVNTAGTCTSPTGVGIDILGKIWVTCLDKSIWRFGKDLNWEGIGPKFGDEHYVYNFFTSHDVQPIYIGKGVSFGYSYKETDSVTTFVAPLPIPSFRGEVIYFEFKTW